MPEKQGAWGEYYEHHAGRAPRPEFLHAVELVKADGLPLGEKAALEIGAGNMIETKALLDAGFGRVVATDMTDGAEWAAASLQMDVNDFATDLERLDFLKLPNEELAPRLEPESMDLVTSYFCLPFTNPDAFPALWQAIVRSLKPGGVVSVTLFGDHDTWAQKTLADGSKAYPGMTFHTREAVDALLADLEDVRVDEEEHDGTTNDGIARHWHTYSVQARRPTDTPAPSHLT
jgi:SAM-dependent methyltransferase